MRLKPDRVITTFRSLLFNIGFFSWTALLSALALPITLLLSDGGAIHRLARIWVRGNFALLRVLCRLDYRVTGQEHIPAGPCIIAAKHQSAWDTMIFEILFDRPSYVLKRELTEIPLFGKAIQLAGNVVVDRSGGSKTLRAMVADARQAVEAGRSIAIFPEGTRTKPGQHLRYHPGVAALYRELAIPVLPVALNSGLFWGRKHFLKHPGTIQLAFLEPIEPGLDRSAFMAELEQRIEGASMRLLEASHGPAAAKGLVDKSVDKSVDKPVDA